MHQVLVVQLARFGDLVQSKRLLLSLADDRTTRVHLAVDASLAPLARILYPFVHVHALPAHAAAGSPAQVFTAARKAFADLADLDCDEVYILNFSPLAFALASLFRPERLRGYGRVKGQDLRGHLPMLSFNLMRDRRFAPLNLADLWAFLHPRPIAPERVNPIPKPAGTGRIGIVMAGRVSRRSLPPDVLATCVNAISQARGGPEFICLGSPQEQAAARKLIGLASPATARVITDQTGVTSLADLPDVLLGLDAVITPDTGIMHLAAHLGVPVHAFFLSSAWCFETGPYGFGHTVWQSCIQCSPCRETDACPHRLACLELFSHKGFLSHISGRFHNQWPTGLIGAITMLDDLGATIRVVDGDDPYAPARQELRNGLAEHLGAIASGMPHPFMSPELADFLFREQDWMLPPELAF